MEHTSRGVIRQGAPVAAKYRWFWECSCGDSDAASTKEAATYTYNEHKHTMCRKCLASTYELKGRGVILSATTGVRHVQRWERVNRMMCGQNVRGEVSS